MNQGHVIIFILNQGFFFYFCSIRQFNEHNVFGWKCIAICQKNKGLCKRLKFELHEGGSGCVFFFFFWSLFSNFLTKLLSVEVKLRKKWVLFYSWKCLRNCRYLSCLFVILFVLWHFWQSSFKFLSRNFASFPSSYKVQKKTLHLHVSGTLGPPKSHTVIRLHSRF